MKKIATIGDPHGCIDEFKELYEKLQWISLDEIWVLGDLVDRGPDSGGVVRFVRKHCLKTVMGNHEESILKLYDRTKKDPNVEVRNQDKLRTISQLRDEDVEFLRLQPRIHVIDEIGLVLVHGGVWPRIPFHEQPDNVVRAQMIHPGQLGRNRWWGRDAAMSGGSGKGKSEEENRKEGWSRWYELYDHEYDVAYGHSVFAQPHIHRNPGAGRTVGCDTASCFGGMITAGIFDGRGDPLFVSVKARKVHCELSRRLVESEYSGSTD